MLKSTFVHIPGVGRGFEEKIWRCNVYNWNEFVKNYDKIPIGSLKKERIHSHIKRSIKACDGGDYRFFIENIPNRLHWRAYRELKDKCCFLDIETTGLDRYNDDITLIGLYDGKESKIFVNGKNLDDFKDEIKKYDVVVTFNGRCFDVPFIKSKFPDVNLDMFHIDLRFAMREIGYSGGLKRIEKMIGLNRDDDLQEVDGFEAVRLWYRYKKGDKEALKLLIRYNKADIENLKVLMDFAFDKLKEKDFLSVIE